MVYAVFNMTRKRLSSQDSCPQLQELTRLNDLSVRNYCNKTAVLTNPTLHGDTVNKMCMQGLVLSDDKKAADLCCKLKLNCSPPPNGEVVK